MHPLQAAYERLDLGRLVGIVGAEEVVPHPDVRHRKLNGIPLVVDAVRLELPRGTLREGVDPRAVPVEQDLLAVRRRRRERHPVGDVVLVRPLRDRGEVRLLERHPAAAEPDAWDGVPVDHREEVVDLVVEVLDVLPVELGPHRSAEEVVGEVHRLGRHLVVERIRGRREEEVVSALLVGVDVHDAGVPAQQLELPVGLALRPREPVAVHVEEVGVLTRLGLATVGVLRRDDPDERVVEDLRRSAVGAVRELVEDAQLRVGAALLAAVDIAHQPEDRRRLGGEAGGLRRRCRGVAEALRRRLDRREPGGRHVPRLADERVAQWATVPRRREDTADDARARGVDRLHVLVGLGRGHLLGAEPEAEHRLCRRRLAGEGRWRLDRVAGRPERWSTHRGRAGESADRDDKEHEQQRATHRHPPLCRILRRRGSNTVPDARGMPAGPPSLGTVKTNGRSNA